MTSPLTLWRAPWPHRLRWWLARRIVPTDIIEHPGNGGVYVLVKMDDDAHLWIEADRFRLRATNYLPALGDMGFVRPGGGRFVGTVKFHD